MAVRGAPLCPAGHLPHEGGDRMAPRLSPIPSVAKTSEAPRLPISPQVGERAGRPEGGVTERQPQQRTTS
ncbi:lytic murein transglycosylase [Mesorhizobium sp. WSM4311]|nr:lytic murein transglycosylase [Mesorhizobium sp. WSM4311]TRD02537.1 lytic murein transglycosylase [Mesorhizobium sp. WSM4305]